MRAFIAAANMPWAITEPALETILTIALRENESVEAVSAKLGRPLENTQATEIRDGVAVIPVNGPIFRHANLFTEISGGTTIDNLGLDFGTALANPAVRAIMLNIDSPGGQASGINELATMIKEARGTKPIVAYVGNLAASAAYWIASAADQIITDRMASLGSIGVVGLLEKRIPSPGTKKFEFVSSVSPHKRLDPESDTGAAKIQALIDAQGEIFVDAVATNRNVNVDRVLSDFGQGNLLIAEDAIAAGMADALGSFEGTIASLSKKSSFSFGVPAAAFNKGGRSVDQEVKPAPVDTAAIAAKAKQDERTRIGAILSCDEANGRESLARTIALETETTPEAARKLLAAAETKQTPAPAANPLEAAMAHVPNPKIPDNGKGAEDDGPAALASNVLAAFQLTQGGSKN